MTSHDIFYTRICGKLLGDGCITKQENRKPRIQFMHRIEDLGWTQYCYEQLNDFFPLSFPAYKKNIDLRLIKGYSECMVVQSRTHDSISELYQTWYPNGKKQIPFLFLRDYLNEEALSWWYQDDGHLKVVGGIMKKIILSTDSFSTEENERLVSMLFEKFGLRFSIDGQNRLVIYDQFQIIYFLQLVSPWLHEAMQRKALVELPLKPIAKRTTIYLPESIKVSKPTAELNKEMEKLESLFSINKDRAFSSILLTKYQHNSIPHSEISISYQIIIQEAHRELLAKIRQKTSLTVSQLVKYCFEN